MPPKLPLCRWVLFSSWYRECSCTSKCVTFFFTLSSSVLDWSPWSSGSRVVCLLFYSGETRTSNVPSAAWKIYLNPNCVFSKRHPCDSDIVFESCAASVLSVKAAWRAEWVHRVLAEIFCLLPLQSVTLLDAGCLVPDFTCSQNGCSWATGGSLLSITGNPWAKS